MPRIPTAVLPLLVGLALSSPGRVVAGPPDRASGKMVLDEVADELRKYRKEKDHSRRAQRLIQLADKASKDPRVAIAIWEAFAEPAGDLHGLAGDLMGMHYIP
jgi:hypothetical protein